MKTYEEAKEMMREASMKIKPENSGKYWNIVLTWEALAIIDEIYGKKDDA